MNRNNHWLAVAAVLLAAVILVSALTIPQQPFMPDPEPAPDANMGYTRPIAVSLSMMTFLQLHAQRVEELEMLRAEIDKLDNEWFSDLQSTLLHKNQLMQQIQQEIANRGPVWISPLLKETRITSPFGMRYHPVQHIYKLHSGVDLSGRTGDTIVAVRDGVVTCATYSASAGYFVMIDHGDGYVTSYMHMNRFVVRTGQTVKAGEVIGYVGATGQVTAAHLHFTISYNGEYVDPEDFIDF